MKKRVLSLIRTYLLFVLLFLLQKPLFMTYYYALYRDVTGGDWWRVMLHGLPLDLSIAGYLTVVPGLLLVASVWMDQDLLRRIRQGYLVVVSVVVSSICVADLGLYSYWGFRLDTTPLFYFLSSPKDALASVSAGVILGTLGALVGCIFALYHLLNKLLNRPLEERPVRHRWLVSTAILLATALLAIPIRGGFGTATMNLGSVFFSANQKLNHAAINPCFSFMDALTRENDFANQYRFFSPQRANELFGELTEQAEGDSIGKLFRVERPNIIMVVLESFSSHLLESLGGQKNVAVQLDSLAAQGVSFTHFYANSWRTDRGLVSIISGYPAQPTTSIMKYTRKTQALPSLPGVLKEAGYDVGYYYGGDADFTNMRSYLTATGIEKIVSETDFDASERLGKWGAHDHVLFNKFVTDLQEQTPKQPFLRILQTSSSHEPFDVPYQRLPNKQLNAFAYTDSCVGNLIHRLKAMPQVWDNTVVVFVPDHQGAYPLDMDNASPDRYRIPLLLVGGAVKEPQRIDTYGSQIDIAATLLWQLGLPHEQFTFSKNLLNPAVPHFAFFTFPDLFGMLTPENEVVFDCASNTLLLDKGTQPGANLEKGKALLQKLYDDLATR